VPVDFFAFPATPRERYVASVLDRIAVQASHQATDLPACFQRADRSGTGLLEASDAKQARHLPGVASCMFYGVNS
jgi:hypothetical protein